MRALEDALNAFAGTAVVISHDRWFLDRICTHILAFEDPEGFDEAATASDIRPRRVVFFPGSWSEYREHAAKQSKSRGNAGAPPKAVGSKGKTSTKKSSKKQK